MANDITKSPSSPSGVTAIKRDDNEFSSSWKNPSSGTSSSSSSRWEYLCRQWQYYNPDAKEKEEKWVNVYNGTIGLNSTSSSWSMNREKYYPVSGKPRVTSVRFRIWSNNRMGDSKPIVKKYTLDKPKAPKVEFDFNEGNRTLEITIDASNNTDTHERYDTEYTVWREDAGLSDSTYANKKWVKALGSNGQPLSGTFKSDKKVLTHSINQANMPTKGARIKICVTTTTRGLAGDTKVDFEKAPTFWIKPPERVKISSISCMNNNKAVKTWTDVKSMGQVFVFYKQAEGSSSAKYDEDAPVSYELQRIVTDATIKTPLQAKASNWSGSAVDTNLGSTSSAVAQSTRKSAKKNEDDACMGEPAMDVLNDMIDHHSVNGFPYDCRVWYRVKSSRQGMETYSEPVEAKMFYVAQPDASGSEAAIVSMEAGDDGTSIDMVIGWNDPNTGAVGLTGSTGSTGSTSSDQAEKQATWTTEVTWSTRSNAWKSNKKPEVFEIDWKDSTAAHNSRLDGSGYIKNDINPQGERVKWPNTAFVSIKDLTVGEEYFVKVRRHMVLDDAESYGNHSRAPDGYWPFMVYDDPSSVVVSTPEVFVLGEDLRVSWSHDSETEQKHWAVYLVQIPNANFSGKASSLKRKLLASGDDASDFTVIPARKLLRCYPYAQVKNTTIATDAQIGIGVGISTGGFEIVSYSDANGDYSGLNLLNTVTRPECGIYVPPTVTSQPFTFYVFTNDSQVKATCNILADGITIPFPDKDLVQARGDYVWTQSLNVASLSWVNYEPVDTSIPEIRSLVYDEGYRYYWRVTVSGLDLYDGASYRVQVRTVSTVSSLLKSEEVEDSFTVHYSHQAKPAGYGSSCTSYLEENPYVEIYLGKPSNWISSDTCNVYRMTPDGGYLIAANVPFGTTVTDRYPPFSKVAELSYILATVTEDGDFEFLEIPYELKRHGLRFDWGEGEFVELPYNIELSDTFQKDTEIRSHTSGTRSAYMNEAITRTGSIQTQLIKLQSPEQFEKVRKLASYPGTALCRAHDGTCYEAVVNVSNIGNSYDSLISPVSITTEEVRLSDRFKADVPQS